MLEAVATDLDRDRQAQTRLDMALAGAPPPNLAVLTMGFLHGLVPVILVSITDAILERYTGRSTLLDVCDPTECSSRVALGRVCHLLDARVAGH
jgi:hypothetical protein